MADKPKTTAELLAEIATLRENNAKLQAKADAKVQPIRFKVSEKGGLSVYGLGRFPVTLYKSQWQRLCGEIPRLQEFIAENSDKLTVKGE